MSVIITSLVHTPELLNFYLCKHRKNIINPEYCGNEEENVLRHMFSHRKY